MRVADVQWNVTRNSRADIQGASRFGVLDVFFISVGKIIFLYRLATSMGGAQSGH